MAQPRTPGFHRVAPGSIYGGGNQKMRGIVLSEHSPNKNQARWVQCPTYDVLLLRDKSILEGVPFFTSAFGTTELEMHRLQQSSASNIAKINRAVAGGEDMPAFDDLEGSGVYVEFDDAGMPFIRTCYPRSMTHSSKIPDGRAVAQSDNAISPDSLDALVERVNADPAAKDDLISEGSYSVIWAAENKYVGEDNAKVPNPPAMASTASKKGMWESIWVIAWRSGFINAYWSGPVVATNDGAVMNAFDNAELEDPNDSEEYIRIKKDAWAKGYRKGDLDGRAELAINPPPPVPDNSGAVSPTDEVTGDPADEDFADYEQVAAIGKKCVFYREHRGVRIGINDDGTFFLDSRSSTMPILVQGGDEGIKLTANGAVIDVASDSENTVRIKADTIQIGTESTCAVDLGDMATVANFGTMWEPLKTLLQNIVNMIETHTHSVTVAGVEPGAGSITTSAAATTSTLTLDDTPKSANVRLT